MLKRFPNSFASQLHIFSDLMELELSNKWLIGYKEAFIRNTWYYIIFKTIKLFWIEKCTNGKKNVFHSLISFKNVKIFKRIVKCKTLCLLKNGYLALVEFTTKKKYIFDLFWACFDQNFDTKCRLVTKYVLSNTHSHLCFFLLFHKNTLYKNVVQQGLFVTYLIYTIIGMIIYLKD